MKIIKNILLILFLLFCNIWLSFATNDKITINFFMWNWCPHCEHEIEFLDKLVQKYDNVEVKKYEVWYDTKNQKILSDLSKKLWINVSGVPFTLIWDKGILWFWWDSTTGIEIENNILHCQENICNDEVADLYLEENLASTWVVSNNSWNIWKNENLWKDSNYKVNIPFFWETNLKNFSLPIISIIIWTLDWFNPCAMWILLFLISMLLWMQNRKRMWILWLAFIFTSAFVYFLFMAAWLNLITFLAYIVWIRALIWIFALAWWTYNIYQYFKEKDNWWCNTVWKEKRKKMFDRIKNIIHEKSFWISLVWICLLAISVNLVELLCSAWLPVVFTQILEINNLSTFSKYAYILLYIFFFMLDDLFIFFVSMTTLHLTWITTKYTKYSHIIWWILMLIIWFLLIFKPEILMFG